MKRLFLTVLGAALLAAPALRAQNLEGIGITVEKVNVEKLKKAIEKSNTEIADPKKGAKASTWVKRGETFLDVNVKPVNGLFVGLDEATLKATFGEATPETVEIGGAPYSVYTYEHFKGYVRDGKLEFYVPVTVVDEMALEKSYEAFDKAYTMDPKTEKKVAVGMQSIRGRGLEIGSAAFSLQNYKDAAKSFRLAYRASAHPSVNNPDTLAIYNAGFLGTIAEDYAEALKDIDQALALGYESNGDTYYYKFHCLYQLGRKDEAVETLEYAITKYPSNDSIIAALLQVYSDDPQKDPTNLIPLVLDVIAKNPTNADLYIGLARVYDKLDQRDNSIEAVRKAAEVDPQNFLANYYIGYYLAKKGDDKDGELRNMTITSRTQYQKALADVNAIYADAVAPLERAYEITPEERATVELLKNLTFRLREDPEMNTKYEKYDAIYKAMEE